MTNTVEGGKPINTQDEIERKRGADSAWNFTCIITLNSPENLCARINNIPCLPTSQYHINTNWPEYQCGIVVTLSWIVNDRFGTHSEAHALFQHATCEEQEPFTHASGWLLIAWAIAPRQPHCRPHLPSPLLLWPPHCQPASVGTIFLPSPGKPCQFCFHHPDCLPQSDCHHFGP